jgi:ketosteroid isomerase-like protein
MPAAGCPGPAAPTPEERRKLWMENFGSPGFSSDEATTQIEVARSGDLAYQRGTYVATLQNERGQVTKSTGKFVVVWKKQTDGRWKAIIDIDNADQ